MGDYRNAMELLVEKEVQQQLEALPPRMRSYINQAELIAYALNQLPTLYATSEQGLEYQLQKGQSKFSTQIQQAVRRALAAVRRDPLRMAIPLKLSSNIIHGEVLKQLKRLLQNDAIEWETLPNAVEQALLKTDLEKHSAYEVSQQVQYRAHTSPNLLRREVYRASQPLHEGRYAQPNDETAIEIAWYG
jgi:Late competence development protein ComFB